MFNGIYGNLPPVNVLRSKAGAIVIKVIGNYQWGFL